MDNPNNRSVLERYGESLSDYKDDFCRSGDDSYLATGIRATYQDTYDGKSTFWFRLVYNLGALGEGAMGQETTTAAELSSGARLGYDMGSYDRINGLINRIQLITLNFKAPSVLNNGFNLSFDKISLLINK